MNVLLWIVQVVLAVEVFSGGLYKIVNFDEIATMPAIGAMPRSGWTAVGVFEIVCAVLLILPAVVKRMGPLTPLAASALALESLALAVLYAQYSLAAVATNPLVWAVEVAVLAAFVAYGRSTRPAMPQRRPVPARGQ